MALHRAKDKVGGGETLNGGSRDVGSILASCPTVQEFLFSSKWPDGQPRSTGTILLFTDLGQLKARVVDKDGSRVAFVSAESLERILDAIEQGLQTDHLDWRADRVYGKGRK
jgi:hypothetical protein